MSAKCRKRTYAAQQIAPLFDHFVGAGEHRWRHVEAERLRSLEVDHGFVFHRRLHGQVGGPLAFEDTINIASRAAELVVGSACKEAAKTQWSLLVGNG